MDRDIWKFWWYGGSAMFARLKTQTNKDGSVRRYLQLVESVRVDGWPRQRVVATLGRLD
jgi:hypothetical protein